MTLKKIKKDYSRTLYLYITPNLYHHNLSCFTSNNLKPKSLIYYIYPCINVFIIITHTIVYHTNNMRVGMGGDTIREVRLLFILIY